MRNLLPRVRTNSFVKFTVPADASRWIARSSPDLDKEIAERFESERTATFNTEFADLLEAKIESTSELEVDFPSYVQKMVRIATQKALPATAGTTFQVLCTASYSDATPMCSVTGIVCNVEHASDIRKWFRDRQFANLDWQPPKEIDVPDLSLKASECT